MSKHKYANFQPKDFDKYNCLTLPLSFYLLLAFLLRAYLVWIMSVTNMRDHVSFLQWVYPEQQLFFVNLVSGITGIFMFVLVALRRPEANAWVKWCWARGKMFLWLALYLDLSITLLVYLYSLLIPQTSLFVHIGFTGLFSVLLLRNKRLSIIFEEFPQHFAEDSAR